MNSNIGQVAEFLTMGADAIGKTNPAEICRLSGTLQTSYALGVVAGLEPTLNYIGTQLTELTGPLGESNVVMEDVLGIWVLALVGTEREDGRQLLHDGATLLEGENSVPALQAGVAAMEEKLGEARMHYEALLKSLGELADMRNNWRDHAQQYAENATRLAGEARTIAADITGNETV